jgi:hypothetical protein
MTTAIDVERIKPVLESMIDKMKALETELLVQTAVLLSLKKGLDAGPQIDKLLEDASRNPDVQTMIAEKYAPLYEALKQWNMGEGFLEMLQDFEGRSKQ